MGKRANIEVKADSMELWMKTSMYLDEGISDESELMKELKHRKITCAVDKDLIDSLFEQLGAGMSIEETLIAQGTPPVMGSNGSVEFYVNVSGNAEVKQLDPTLDRIDFKEQRQFTVVKAKQAIGKIIPPTQGIDGKNIYGTSLKSRDGLPYNIILDEGVERVGDEIISTNKGIPHYTSRLLKVHDCMTIHGDVGPETGNIKASGCLHISGDIMEGYSVSCNDDIFVSGTAHSCSIESEGNLVIKGGIHGSEDHLIKVHGDLTCGHIEGGQFEVNGKVLVQKNVMHANIDSLESIEVKGDVVGGELNTLKSIKIKSSGNDIGTKTYLRVLQHFEIKKYQTLKQKLFQVVDNIRKDHFKSLGRYEPDIEIRVKISQDIEDIEKKYIPQINKLQQLIIAYEQLIEKIAYPIISFDKECHSDTHIQIGSHKLHVRELLPAKASFVRNPEFQTIEVKNG